MSWQFRGGTDRWARRSRAAGAAVRAPAAVPRRLLARFGVGGRAAPRLDLQFSPPQSRRCVARRWSLRRCRCPQNASTAPIPAAHRLSHRPGASTGAALQGEGTAVGEWCPTAISPRPQAAVIRRARQPLPLCASLAALQRRGGDGGCKASAASASTPSSYTSKRRRSGRRQHAPCTRHERVLTRAASNFGAAHGRGRRSAHVPQRRQARAADGPVAHDALAHAAMARERTVMHALALPGGAELRPLLRQLAPTTACRARCRPRACSWARRAGRGVAPLLAAASLRTARSARLWCRQAARERRVGEAAPRPTRCCCGRTPAGVRRSAALARGGDGADRRATEEHDAATAASTGSCWTWAPSGWCRLPFDEITVAVWSIESNRHNPPSPRAEKATVVPTRTTSTPSSPHEGGLE